MFTIETAYWSQAKVLFQVSIFIRAQSQDYHPLSDVALSAKRAGMVKKAYGWLTLSVACTSLGGIAGANTRLWHEVFFTWAGLVGCGILLLLIPRFALAARGHQGAGIAVLAGCSLLSGFSMAPLAEWVARHSPGLMAQSAACTLLVFLATAGLVFASRENFRTTRGLLAGCSISFGGALLINAASGFQVAPLVAAAFSGTLATLVLITATAEVLRDEDVKRSLPAALTLFAATFNVFVALVSLSRRLIVR